MSRGSFPSPPSPTEPEDTRKDTSLLKMPEHSEATQKIPRTHRATTAAKMGYTQLHECPSGRFLNAETKKIPWMAKVHKCIEYTKDSRSKGTAILLLMVLTELGYQTWELTLTSKG